MLKSMTAYGRASLPWEGGEFVAEIQSVNRRFLEVNCQFPSEWSAFEYEARQQLAKRIKRGNITVRLSCALQGQAASSAKLHAFAEKWNGLSRELGGTDLDPTFLLKLYAQQESSPSQNRHIPALDTVRPQLTTLIEEALDRFVAMRSTEGKALTEDIEARLEAIGSHLKFIESKAPFAPERYRQKLQDKLKELSLLEGPEQAERLIREVALYAERIDTAEEITRAHSHLKQMRELLSAEPSQEGHSAGNLYNFLLQELQREFNTLGSKSADTEISQRVVLCKAEIERIREQVQNVE